MSGGGGRNRTHRTGIARPTRVEDEGGHQTPFTSGADATGAEPLGSLVEAEPKLAHAIERLGCARVHVRGDPRASFSM